MPLLSITRLQLRSWRYLPQFLWHARRSEKQAAASPALLAGRTAVGRGLVFWTTTLWEDLPSMQKFLVSGAHLKAMPKLRRWCKHAAVRHLTTNEAVLPEMAQIDELLRLSPKFSPLDHADADHAAKKIPAFTIWPVVEFKRPRAAASG
ncbi:MAG: hypothetical protein ACXWP5_00690 [Bdellovibrionota bacterium]